MIGRRALVARGAEEERRLACRIETKIACETKMIIKKKKKKKR